MICRITGTMLETTDVAAIVSIGPIAYEILVPACDLAEHDQLRGQEVTLHTIEYLEGNPAASNFTPRRIGFLREADKAFFQGFIKVKGVSARKALKAMSVPVHQIANAIEQGDIASLTALPEIGKKTATQIVAELRGKLEAHALPSSTPVSAVVPQLSTAQQTALQILVGWGDKAGDAQRWIVAACEADTDLDDPQDIVTAAYRMRGT